ncbi:iron complex transport system substrate-binding protein [Caulobacter rhizosphaerae]|uniref:Iron complex transport system substrate-binding protein n=1 Tax=Caulobacter rhizosphaerae TaxID=2010972 RepID=A0ABU1MYY2_9CAUL|nr:ABC transporter substrate-binding protein [Caulobacter rhizosphaerae]MDR6531383.1 iron complex transport system substrate-binding protein [Caulobacter rhizosphaerae]
MTGFTRRAAVGAGLATGFLGGVASAGALPRVVSLNPCLDAVLVNVADRGQVAALSHYARDPQQSSIARIALGYPITYESAEEVIALRPDLVLTAAHSSPATRAALTRLGIRTELFKVPNSWVENQVQIRRIAAAVGHPDRGEALIARVEAAMTRSAPRPGARPVTALVFQPNGFAAGHGTLVDEMMRRAGFVNVAQRYGLKKWGNVSLERLLDDPPEVLLAGQAAPNAPTFAEKILNHPALASIASRMTRAVFPERLLYCGGPGLADTAAALATARRQVLGAAA